MSDEWNKVETETWKPDEGDEISGVYLGVQEDVGENKSKLYTIETENAKQIAVWGAHVLDGKMIGLVVGQQVKIKFIGMVKPETGREYKNYEVFKKPVNADATETESTPDTPEVPESS